MNVVAFPKKKSCSRNSDLVSPSLEIGFECLCKNKDAAEAIEKHPDHSSEIILASLFNKLSGSSPFDEALIRHLHTLISACDHINYRIN